MLVLSRKKNDGIVVNNDITITVVEIRDDKVRLGVIAPKEVPVHRLEVFEAIHGRPGSEPEPAPWVVMPRAPEVPEVSKVTSVNDLVHELGRSGAETKIRFTSEGGIQPTEVPPEKVVVLKERAQGLFDRLLRAASRETLVKLTTLLSQLIDSTKRMR